jgi:hypothetical protein
VCTEVGGVLMGTGEAAGKLAVSLVRNHLGPMWWYTPVISAFGWLRQDQSSRPFWATCEDPVSINEEPFGRLSMI